MTQLNSEHIAAIRDTQDVMRKYGEGHYMMNLFFRMDHSKFKNRDRARMTVADAIHDCGTTMCLAGFALLAVDPGQVVNDAGMNAFPVAEHAFGLTHTQARLLFLPDHHAITQEDPAVGIAALETVIEGDGWVDWSEAYRRTGKGRQDVPARGYEYVDGPVASGFNA